METTSKLDDQQWLAYWILYSFLTLLEMLLQPLLEWYTDQLNSLQPNEIWKKLGLPDKNLESKYTMFVWLWSCRIPIWYDIKLVFAAWLVLPQFRGAAFIYEKIVREKLFKINGDGAVHSPKLFKANGDGAVHSPKKSPNSSRLRKLISFSSQKKWVPVILFRIVKLSLRARFCGGPFMDLIPYISTLPLTRNPIIWVEEWITGAHL